MEVENYPGIKHSFKSGCPLKAYIMVAEEHFREGEQQVRGYDTGTCLVRWGTTEKPWWLEPCELE